MINFRSPTLKFSVSGLRGVFPDDINAQNIPDMIWAFDKSLPAGPVALARDNRPTGEAIQSMVAGVLTSLGRIVYLLDIVPTPTIKAYIKENSLAGGIMISASHNPMQYAAFKFIKKDGYFFSATENSRWQRSLAVKRKSWGRLKRQGQIIQAHNEAINEHVVAVLQSVGKLAHARTLRVAIDPLAACASEIAPLLLEELGVEVFAIHDTIENRFPRPPEPVPSALKKLGQLVRKHSCDLGFAFDPDADRLAIVGPDGRALGEELTVPLVLHQALTERPSNVVVNLSSSWLNQWVTEKNRQKFYRSKVGEANVVAMMTQKKSSLGGEGNGGVIDLEVPSLGRDAICGMAWVIRALRASRRSLPEILEEFPPVFMAKQKIKVKRSSELTKIGRHLEKKLKGFKKDTRDGIHLSAKGGLPWVHLRASNTEPIVRFMAEAGSKKELGELTSLLFESK